MRLKRMSFVGLILLAVFAFLAGTASAYTITAGTELDLYYGNAHGSRHAQFQYDASGTWVNAGNYPGENDMEHFTMPETTELQLLMGRENRVDYKYQVEVNDEFFTEYSIPDNFKDTYKQYSFLLFYNVDEVVWDSGINKFKGCYVGVKNSAVPVPPAAWLLGSGLVGLVGLRKRLRKS